MEDLKLMDRQDVAVAVIRAVAENKPLYAPAIVRAFFRGNEWCMFSCETVAQETGIELRVVRLILNRLVKDKWLCRRLVGNSSKARFYFFEEYARKNKAT